MLYVSLDNNQIKVLYLKKTLLGQYETSFFQKKHEVDLLRRGKAYNVDVLASAIKEAITHLEATQEKQIFLILPQESFSFFRSDVPKDISSGALSSFVTDKAKSTLPNTMDRYFSDYFLKDSDKQKRLTFFAIQEETVAQYAETLNLLGLKVVSVLPDSLAYFKLFEKTLRSEKKENILYATYGDSTLLGYVFDSYGLSVEDRWIHEVTKDGKLAEVLKKKRLELEEKGQKLNRIILSGEGSEKIRQDTFTKEVGVWTNPLKRIVPNFYQEYLKQLVVAQGTTLPILAFDVCFGAFVFAQENKDFQILKKPFKTRGGSSFSLSSLPIFRKEFLIFLISAIISFGAFVGLSRLNINFGGFKLPDVSSFLSQKKESVKPTAVPAKKPSPTPSFKKAELRIKVLNGSGTAGVASSFKDVLVKKGYQEIVTGNADNFDYTKTVIQVKDSVKGAADVLKKDLADDVPSPKIEKLAEKEASDVVIIVGTDFK